MEQIDKPPRVAFSKRNSCPICGEAQKISNEYLINYYSSTLLDLSLINNPPKIFLLSCSNCSHRFPSYLVNPEIVEYYYSEISAEVYLNKNSDPFDALKAKHIKIAKEIEKQYPHGGRILDIGCGYGFLLSYLNQNKWSCYGIEPSDLAAEIAKSKGINILAKFINESKAFNERFDVVILLDVIEHISDPLEFINKAYNLVGTAGIIIIGTGDINSLNARIGGSKWSYFCSYEHISFFTSKSILKLLSNFAFQDIKIRKIPYRPGFIFNTYTLVKNLIKILLFRVLKLKKNYSIHLAFDHIVVFAKISGRTIKYD